MLLSNIETKEVVQRIKRTLCKDEGKSLYFHHHSPPQKKRQTRKINNNIQWQQKPAHDSAYLQFQDCLYGDTIQRHHTESSKSQSLADQPVCAKLWASDTSDLSHNKTVPSNWGTHLCSSQVNLPMPTSSCKHTGIFRTCTRHHSTMYNSLFSIWSHLLLFLLIDCILSFLGVPFLSLSYNFTVEVSLLTTIQPRSLRSTFIIIELRKFHMSGNPTKT